MKTPVALGIDIGGTKIALALLQEDGEVIDTGQTPFPAGHSPSDMLSIVNDITNEMLTRTGRPLAGIGIGCPGQVHVKSGLVKNAVNLGWPDVNLIYEVKNRLSTNVPVYIRKDADANLLGEFHYGAARDFFDIVYICIGSGLGCSIMSGGRLIDGATGTAGGIGHIHLDGNSEKCPCGLIGCAETLISGPGLVKRMRKIFYSQSHDTNPKLLDTLTPAHVIAAAATGDKTARQALSDMSEGLGQLLAISISFINPQAIVVGGGLGLAVFDEIMPVVTTVMKKHSLPHTYENLKILPASQKSSAIGAASLVWKSNQTLKRR